MNKNTKRKTAFFCCVILAVAAFSGGNHYSVFAETITQDLVEIDDGFYERLEDDEISLTGIENTDTIRKIIKKEKPKTVELRSCTINDPNLFDGLTIENLRFNYASVKAKRLKMPAGLFELTFENCDAEENQNFRFLKGQNYSVITFRRMDIDNLKFMKGIGTIESLYFDNTSIGSLEGIDTVKKIYSLELSYTGLDDISPLDGNIDLKCLTLHETNVDDVSLLANTNISSLELFGSPIKSYEPLTRMDSLKELSASDNEMSYDPEVEAALISKLGSSPWKKDAAKIKEKVQTIAKEITDGSMTEREKIKAITLYIMDHLTYDYRINKDDDLIMEYNDHQLEYALEDKGICINYAKLAQALFTEAGIENYTQMSTTHIWNVIKLDGEYYSHDITLLDIDNDKEGSDAVCWNLYYLCKWDKNDFPESPIPSQLYNELREKEGFFEFTADPDDDKFYDELTTVPVSRETTGVTAALKTSSGSRANKAVICGFIAAAIVIVATVTVVVIKKKKQPTAEAENKSDIGEKSE